MNATTIETHALCTEACAMIREVRAAYHAHHPARNGTGWLLARAHEGRTTSADIAELRAMVAALPVVAR